MVNDHQFTNQFFEEGRMHQEVGGSIKDCPYNYLSDDVDQYDDKAVQTELYRQQEWYAGFHHNFLEKVFESKKTA